MPPRISNFWLSSLFKRNATTSTSTIAKRTLIAAPKPGSGPLMTRRSDRALPEVTTTRWKPLRSIPIFVVIVGGSALAIFNYQKLSSSVVSSTLYALRTNEEARAALGDEIYFASKIPYIGGSIDQLHGRIDINYRVKGKRQSGVMRFKSVRKSRMGYFETSEWSLTTEDGNRLELLRPDRPDPFKNIDSGEDSMAQELA